MFEWNDRYSVSIPDIDRQHKQLFEIAERLRLAMSTGKSKDVLGPILSKLIAYAKEHFATEEQLLKAVEYPALAEHVRAHSQLTGKVLEFQKDFEAGKIAMSIGLMQFLETWLKQHILSADKQYAPYVKPRVA